jgi:hypothetical protein
LDNNLKYTKIFLYKKNDYSIVTSHINSLSLGDILSGAIALFAYWAKWKNVKVKTEKQQKVIIGGEQQQQQQVAYTSVHMMAGAMAASQLVRRASRETFMVCRIF